MEGVTPRGERSGTPSTEPRRLSTPPSPAPGTGSLRRWAGAGVRGGRRLQEVQVATREEEGAEGTRTELLEGRFAWTLSGQRREERGTALGGHLGLGGRWPLSNPSSTSQKPCPPEPWLQ